MLQVQGCARNSEVSRARGRLMRDFDASNFFPFTFAVCDGSGRQVLGCDDLMGGIMLVETASHERKCAQLWDDNEGVLIATATLGCGLEPQGYCTLHLGDLRRAPIETE